jgi:hypothetical protein
MLEGNFFAGLGGKIAVLWDLIKELLVALELAGELQA